MNILGNIRSPTIKEASGIVIAIAALFSAMSVLGIGIITPWPARADVESLQTTITRQQKQIDAILAQSATQTCALYQLLRDQYQEDRDEAQEEYNKTRSAVALRARDEAAKKVEQMEAKLNAAPCV